MKTILFYSKNIPHHKNICGLRLMCKSAGIKLVEQLKTFKSIDKDTILIISNDSFISFENITCPVLYGPQVSTFLQRDIIPQLKQYKNKYNVLSEWNQNIQELHIHPEHKTQLVQIPFAIDTNLFYDASSFEKNIDCIVYIKHRNQSIINMVLEIVNKYNLNIKVFNYERQYLEKDYIDALKHSKFIIGIAGHESQGFWYLEAFSMNVPILSLDVSNMLFEVNKQDIPVYSKLQYLHELPATSVPYIDNRCGIVLKDYDLFESKLLLMLQEYQIFSPRLYILENLSPEKCMERLLLISRL